MRRPNLVPITTISILLVLVTWGCDSSGSPTTSATPTPTPYLLPVVAQGASWEFAIHNADLHESLAYGNGALNPKNGAYLVLIGDLLNSGDESGCKTTSDWVVVNTETDKQYNVADEAEDPLRALYPLDEPGWFFGTCLDPGEKKRLFVAFDVNPDAKLHLVFSEGTSLLIDTARAIANAITMTPVPTDTAVPSATPLPTSTSTTTVTPTSTPLPTSTTTPSSTPIPETVTAIAGTTQTAAVIPTLTPTQTTTRTPTPTLDPNNAGTTDWITYEHNTTNVSVRVATSKWRYEIDGQRASSGNIYLLLMIVYQNNGGLAKDASAGAFNIRAGNNKTYGWDSLPDPVGKYNCSFILADETCTGWWVTEIPDIPVARSRLTFIWFAGWETFDKAVFKEASLSP